MYDAIIVGARVAGSSTGLLLARKGYRVLLVDRATFPSDTLSTHQIQLPGSAALKRWGLLDKVIATGPGKADQVRFDIGEIIVTGQFPEVRESLASNACFSSAVTLTEGERQCHFTWTSITKSRV
jgi:2-polyprenyl-6-methoxyphenol hydroxylase-like FAD-dependent oxidoreductase